MYVSPQLFLSKNLYRYQKWGLGRSPKQGEGGSPTFPPFLGKGGFGKDAEIRTHQALHEAKPSECPKGDRDSKLEVYFKNRLFLQSESCDEMYVSPQLFLLLFLLSYNTIRYRNTSVSDSQTRFSHILQKFFFIFGT